MLVDRRNASRITSSRSSKSATFILTGWRLSHPKQLPVNLPVPLECHALALNITVLQLSDAVADASMLQCCAQFRILFINAHFVADNVSHALASSATVKPTFNVEEEVVIRNGWTRMKKRRKSMDDSCTIARSVLGCVASQEHEDNASLYVDVMWKKSSRSELVQEFHGKYGGVSRINYT